MSRLITNSIRSTSASTDAFTLDGSGNATCSGRLLQSTLPSFGAYGAASWTAVDVGSPVTPVLTNTTHNVGTCYNTSNGTFTAPVAGIYMIMFHTLCSTSDDSMSDDTRSFDMFFVKNGSNLTRHHQKRGYKNDGDVQNTLDMTCTELLAANDTIKLQFSANSHNQRFYGTHTYFGVTLLG